jgi:hypothetical protein
LAENLAARVCFGDVDVDRIKWAILLDLTTLITFDEYIL